MIAALAGLISVDVPKEIQTMGKQLIVEFVETSSSGEARQDKHYKYQVGLHPHAPGKPITWHINAVGPYAEQALEGMAKKQACEATDEDAALSEATAYLNSLHPGVNPTVIEPDLPR